MTLHDDRTAPATYEDLVALLQERLPGLPPAQRRLAERVMADPEGIAFMTAAELASSANVNASTVVRFATGLGLAGYPGLARLCRATLRTEAQLVRRFATVEDLETGSAAGTTGAVRPATASDEPLERAAAFDQANIARTFARVDQATWSATVAALAEAPRVHVLGLRKCYSVAFLLGYLLRLVRDEVETLTPGAGTLVEDLRRVRPGDCFVGISLHRYSRDTVRCFRRASDQGATTIALTDNPASPLAAAADHSFYAEVAGVAVLRSVTALVSLAQALANAVAAARGAETRSALTVEEALLDAFDTYERA